MAEQEQAFWEAPDSFLTRSANLSPEQAGAELKALLNAQVDRPDADHGAWADLAETLNQPALALREAQLAVRDRPTSLTALKRLGRLLMERGQPARAAVHFETALQQAPEDAELQEALADCLAAQDPEPEEVSGPTPAEAESAWPLEASAIRFLQAFGGREDMHARQWASRDGRSGYTPVSQPLTPRLIQGHLAGNETLGVYCLRLDGTVTFLAFDLDITKGALEEALVQPDRAAQLRQALNDGMRLIQAELSGFGLPSLLENSGYKGRHVWLLFSRPIPADVAHLFVSLMLRRFQARLPVGLHLEGFPKQGDRDTRKGLGNLIKLPLGLHRKSGRRSHFLLPEGEPVSSWDRHLAQTPRVEPESLYAAIETLKLENLPPIAADEATGEPDILPAPPSVQRVWTEADFRQDAEVAHVLANCPVLRRLKHQAEHQRQLNHHEQLVLIHTLGRLRQGVLAVNYLFARCANVAPERFLKSRLAGNPVSCARIRSRIPHITSSVRCQCDFSAAPDQYPTPELHLRTLADAPPQKEAADLETLARRYAALERRLEELQTEHRTLGLSLAAQLRQLPEPILQLDEGRYVLKAEGETETLVWQPQTHAADPHGA